MRRISVHLVAVTLAATAQAAPPCITIVATNDHHGTIEARDNSAGDHKVRAGGVVALSGYVDILRQRFGKSLLLVDAGDIYQGTLVSNHFEGKPIIDAMSAMGYAASVLGNHEFDYGPGKAGGKDRLAVLKQRAQEASFPLLGLNVFDRSTNKPLAGKNLQPSMMVQVGEVPVGIIGLATVDTPRQTKPENVTSLEFKAPDELVIREAAALRKAGAKLVVLVAHMGAMCHDTRDADDLSSCELNEELTALLRRLPAKTIDVAAGGHTHREIAHWVNGVAAVEAGAYARKLSRVDVCLAEGGGIDKQRSTIHRPQDVCLTEWEDGGCGNRKQARAVRPATYLGSPIKPMPAVEKLVAPYLAAVKRLEEEPIGVQLPHPLKRDGGAGDLGLLVVEAMARTAKVQLALTNLGGVRDDLPGGALNFSQVYRVLPFGNQVVVLDVTGAQLRAAIMALTGRRGASPYLWGVRPGPRGEGSSLVLANGAELDDKATYSVAVTDFLAMGGDGLEMLSGLPAGKRRTLDATDLDALIALLKERFPARKT